MNNKRGGLGTKFILILILMLASAAGGAYAYRTIDGQMAVREANKIIAKVEVSDYDSFESGTIQEYIDKATKDLETTKTRKEAYEILTDFNDDVSKVLTSAQKELQAARDANNQSENLSNNTENDTPISGLFDGLLKDDSANKNNNSTDAFR